MKTLLVTLGLVAAVLLAPRPGAAHWVSLAPPPYAYAQPYPYAYPYAYGAYPLAAVPAPVGPCVVGPTGPLCTAGAYYPGWQYRREWDTDYIWRNTGPHVRGYSFH